jgi:hypothetical protein
MSDGNERRDEQGNEHSSDFAVFAGKDDFLKLIGDRVLHTQKSC